MNNASLLTDIGRVTPKITTSDMLAARAAERAEKAAIQAAERAKLGKPGRILVDFNANPKEFLSRPMLGDDVVGKIRKNAAKMVYGE